MSLVTVVVPTYNRPKYLREALESLQLQTFTDFCVVIADDASEVDLTSLVKSFDDHRFTLLRRPANVGMVANIWPTLADAETKYVATLHDDDRWEPKFLSIMVSALEAHPSASVAFSDFWHVDQAGIILANDTESSCRTFGRADLDEGLHDTFVYNAVWLRAIPSAMAAVFRHTSIDWENLPQEVGTFYDEWLSYLAVRHQQPVWYTPRRLSRYRVHQASETSPLGVSTETRLRQLLQAEFISRAKSCDPLVNACHSHLIRQNRVILAQLLIVSSISKRPELAKDRILAARKLHAPMVIWCFLLLTRMPPDLARFMLMLKRFLAKTMEW